MLILLKDRTSCGCDVGVTGGCVCEWCHVYIYMFRVAVSIRVGVNYMTFFKDSFWTNFSQPVKHVSSVLYSLLLGSYCTCRMQITKNNIFFYESNRLNLYETCSWRECYLTNARLSLLYFIDIKEKKIYFALFFFSLLLFSVSLHPRRNAHVPADTVATHVPANLTKTCFWICLPV